MRWTWFDDGGRSGARAVARGTVVRSQRAALVLFVCGWWGFSNGTTAPAEEPRAAPGAQQTASPRSRTPIAARDLASAEKKFAEAEALFLDFRYANVGRILQGYRDASAAWRRMGKSREEAKALVRIGNVYETAERNEEARRAYEQALEISRVAGDSLVQAQALNGLGHACAQLEQFPKAFEYLNQALALGRSDGNRAEQARSLNHLGEAFYDSGQIRLSFDHLERALEIWRELDDPRGRALTLLNLGYASADLNDLPKALAFYTQALDLWRTSGDRRSQGRTLASLVQLHTRTGDFEKALDAFAVANPLVQAVDDRVGRARLCNSLSYLYRQLGESVTALFYSREAARLLEELGYRLQLAFALQEVGKNHAVNGEYARAAESFQRAMSISREIEDKRLESLALMHLGLAYHGMGQGTKAAELCGNALLMHEARGDRRLQGQCLRFLAEIYEAVGDKERSIDFFRRSVPCFQGVADGIGEGLALAGVARAERDRGNLDAALSFAEEAVRSIETLRVRVPSLELRATYAASYREPYDVHVDTLMRLNESRPRQAFDSRALEAAERGRARSLIDLLLEARADIRRGIDAELLEKERRLRSELGQKAQEQTRLLSGKPDKEKADALSQEIRRLDAEYEQLQAQIRTRNRQYAALMQPPPLSLEEIRKQVLDSGTLLLEYALGDSRSFLWAVTEDAVISHVLPSRAEIEQKALSLRELLMARQRTLPGETERQRHLRVSAADERFHREAAELSRLLLGPVATELAGRRLLIVPDGALQYISFAALPVPLPTAAPRDAPVSGRPSVEGPVPLIARHEVVLLPSASVLSTLRGETAGRKRAPRTVAVFADPVFERDDPRFSMPSGKPAGPRLPVKPRAVSRGLNTRGPGDSATGYARLSFTRAEADAILSVVDPATAFRATGFNASRGAVATPGLAQYRVIHFATHGEVQDEHPKLSGIVLSLLGRDGKAQEGFLRLSDIYNLNLPVELVVLSACNTALGRNVRGEGMIGLVRGFMYAGAPRVLATLWKVEDESTAELMGHFYRRLFAQGMPASAALRSAQSELWRSKRWSAPYYWAGFVLQGEYR